MKVIKDTTARSMSIQSQQQREFIHIGISPEFWYTTLAFHSDSEEDK